jgi:hypothetical protein
VGGSLWFDIVNKSTKDSVFYFLSPQRKETGLHLDEIMLSTQDYPEYQLAYSSFIPSQALIKATLTKQGKKEISFIHLTSTTQKRITVEQTKLNCSAKLSRSSIVLISFDNDSHQITIIHPNNSQKPSRLNQRIDSFILDYFNDNLITMNKNGLFQVISLPSGNTTFQVETEAFPIYTWQNLEFSSNFHLNENGLVFSAGKNQSKLLLFEYFPNEEKKLILKKNFSFHSKEERHVTAFSAYSNLCFDMKDYSILSVKPGSDVANDVIFKIPTKERLEIIYFGLEKFYFSISGKKIFCLDFTIDVKSEKKNFSLLKFMKSKIPPKYLY